MGGQRKGDRAAAPEGFRLPVMGLEAEFNLVVDGQPARPEDWFDDPRDFVRAPMLHRQGRSYHLPTGAAVYFDTGVIEVATPVVEIERGCAARAGRLLWEAVQCLRGELDAWEQRAGHDARLAGFSAHYNVSFDVPPAERMNGRSIARLAKLLAFILPAPLMLVAANRASTGIGVRPRPGRIEITADFTPDPARMIAAATIIAAVVRSVMAWPGYGLDELERRGIPVIRGFRPMPHTSRKGWLARFDCYPANPFSCDIDAQRWATLAHGNLSLRRIAALALRPFWRAIGRMADPATFRLIGDIVRGRAASLLELQARPAAYEDVGRLCAWAGPPGGEALGRSRYERLVLQAVSGATMYVGGRPLRPVGMQGWSGIVFADARAGREVIGLDELLATLDTPDRN